MKSPRGWVQGYNAQLAVTDDQIILAARVTRDCTDVGSFQPMMEAAQRAAERLSTRCAGPDRTIGTVLADAGYLSEHNLTVPGPDRLIATGKRAAGERRARLQPAAGPPPDGLRPIEAMRHRLRTPEDLARYRRRGVTVEPVIGHLKDIVGLRRFSCRGLDAADAELHLASATANLLKLHRAGGFTP